MTTIEFYQWLARAISSSYARGSQAFPVADLRDGQMYRDGLHFQMADGTEWRVTVEQVGQGGAGNDNSD